MNPSFCLARKKIITVVTSLFMLQSQTLSQLSSYATPIDARSVAMGESFVAVEQNVNGLIYNPASLARLKGMSTSYSYRSLDWSTSTKDMRFQQYDIAVQTPVAVFGFFYSRFKLGEIVRTNSSGIETARYSMYDHTFSIAAARAFDCGISLGVAAKTWNIGNVRMTSASNPEGFDNAEHTLPILFDVGVNYAASFAASSISNMVTAGFSLQNFGSNFKTTDKITNQTQSEQLMRFLRLGLAHSLSVGASIDQLTAFQTLTTFEYRRHLNGFSNATADLYGFGIELAVFELATLRGGGQLSNSTSIYGNKKEVAWRYGFGLNVPLRKLGTNIPFKIQADYTVIPVNNNMSSIFFPTRKTLQLYSITIQYDNDVF